MLSPTRTRSYSSTAPARGASPTSTRRTILGRNRSSRPVHAPIHGRAASAALLCCCHRDHDRVGRSRFVFFFFNDTATTEIYTLSLHDALPISSSRDGHPASLSRDARNGRRARVRSEEHTSELQSRSDLVCRLLLEKKKKKNDRQVCIYNHKQRVRRFD